MRSPVGLVVLVFAACSSQPRTPVDEEIAVVSTPAVPQRTVLGDAYAAYAADPGSAVKQRAYFDAFPNDYAALRKIFGFEEIGEDSVVFGECYEQGNDMIGAFFDLDSLPVKDIATKAIGIACKGMWQADGVGYFQLFLMKDLEKSPSAYMAVLNSLPRPDQAGFWKFYTDGPEAFPQEDKSRLRGLLVNEQGQLAALDSVLAIPRVGH